MRLWLFALLAVLPWVLPPWAAAIAQTDPIWPDEQQAATARPPSPWFTQGSVEIAPRVDLLAGWNSAAGGGKTASSVAVADFGLGAKDKRTGSAALLGASITRYGQAPAQDTSSVRAGIGQDFTLGDDTLSLAGGFSRTVETALDLGAAASARPFVVRAARADASATIPLATVTIEPALGVSRVAARDAPYENALVSTQSVTATTTGDGVLSLRGQLGESEADYEQKSLSASDTAFAAGFRYQPDPIWRIDGGFGGAWRVTRGGRSGLGLVADAGVLWSPDPDDSVTLSAFRDAADPADAGGAADSETRIEAQAIHDLPRDTALTLDVADDSVRYRGGLGTQALLTATASLKFALGRLAAIELVETYQRRTGGGARPLASEQITVGAAFSP